MAIVYIHTRPDTQKIFYVGIGKTNRRAKSRCHRSIFWHNIVNKNNKEFIVSILLENLTWEEACEREKILISFYGRKDLNKGSLCNLTDGGDGRDGYIMTEKEKEQRRGKTPWNKGLKLGPLSEEHKKKVGLASKKSYANRSPEKEKARREKISKGNTGNKRPDLTLYNLTIKKY